MITVLYCAAAIGGATVIGTLIGFIWRREAEKYAPNIMSLSAGVMLAAAADGLISPAFEGQDALGVAIAVLGLIAGAMTLYSLDRFMPISSYNNGTRSAILFAIAVAIHNFPEGLAAGFSFAAGSQEDALAVTIGIALHNIPEGMIAVFPLLANGASPPRALILSLSGGAAEVLGTLIGFCAGGYAEGYLPLLLSFAGGTMLYAILGELVPEGHSGGRRRSSFLIILGYALMSSLKALLGG
jgi:ZIP family zinc transporter